MMRRLVGGLLVLSACGVPDGGSPPLTVARVGSTDKIVHGSAGLVQTDGSIAVNSSGTVMIAGFDDYRGYDPSFQTYSIAGIARSTDGGATWSELSRLPTVTNGQVKGPIRVRYDATRNIFVASNAYTGPSGSGVSLHTSDSTGLTWTGPIEVTPSFVAGGFAQDPVLDIDPGGRWMVAWTEAPTGDYPNILTSYSDDAGATWSTAITLGASSKYIAHANASFGKGPTNSAPSAFVVWVQLNNPTQIMCVRSTNGGASWPSVTVLDTVNDADTILGVGSPGGTSLATSVPSIATDVANNRAYVVYQRNDATGTGDIALQTFTGACPASPLPWINLSPGQDDDRAQFLPSVAVDPSTSYVHVTYYDQSTGSGDVVQVMHTMSKDQGATWSPPTPINDRPFHAAYGEYYLEPNLGYYNEAVARSGKLNALFTGTSVEPHFDEGLPAQSLLSPDMYFDQRLDTDTIVPLALVATTASEVGCASGTNGLIDPGETIALTVQLRNYVTNPAVGAATLTSISGTLTTTTTGVTITGATATWTDLAAGASGTDATSFQLQLASSFTPGTHIDLILSVTATQGKIEIPIRLDTGTPGTATTLVSENFEGAGSPFPAGWTSVDPSGGGATWQTASNTLMSSKYAMGGVGGTQWSRLVSPTVSIPSVSGAAYVSVNFDTAYTGASVPGFLLDTYSGTWLSIADMNGSTEIRSISAEAFAQRIRTGTADNYPKRLRAPNGYFGLGQHSAWGGDSGGTQHVSMQFPATGMMGHSVQLRFDYYLGTTVCAPSCGVVAVDNVAMTLVPLIDAHCQPPCGNGVVESGEQCDQGAANGTAASCCTASCQFQPVTHTCRSAADACDAAEVCTGSSATCPVDGKQPNNTPCPDSTVCNGNETCQSGVCTSGTALDCNDSNVCTTDTCDPVTGCHNTNVSDNTACDDATVCNGHETCQAGTCTAGTPLACDDGNACTADACDATIGCFHGNVADNTPCPDSNVCNGAETCQSGVCSAGTALSCDDGNPCTTDSCDAVAGCMHTNTCVVDAGVPDASAPDATPAADAGVTPDAAPTTSQHSGGCCDAGAPPASSGLLMLLVCMKLRRGRRN